MYRTTPADWNRVQQNSHTTQDFVNDIIEMVVMSDKYQCPSIKADCIRKLMELPFSVQNCEYILALPTYVTQVSNTHSTHARSLFCPSVHQTHRDWFYGDAVCSGRFMHDSARQGDL